MLRSLRIPVAFLVTGLLWAFLSDPIITLFFSHLDNNQQDIYRSINDIFFVMIISFLLYSQIGRQERKLIRSEEEYRQLFESNPNPMWIYDTETFKFIKVNNAAIDKYGYSRKQFLQMTIFDIRPPYDHAKVKLFVLEVNGGIKNSGIWEHLKASGEKFKVSIVSHMVTFNNKKCSMVMATDITELLDKEEKLKEAHKKIKKHNDTLLEINWSHSHELRKPLCSIISLVDLLQQSTDENEKEELLDFLKQSSAELDDLFRKNNERLHHII